MWFCLGHLCAFALQSYSESITMGCFRGFRAGSKAHLALWEIGIRVCVEGGRER